MSLDINDTATHTDDVMLLGADPISMRVTLHDSDPGSHTVTLQEMGSSANRASLSQYTLTLSDDESAEVSITALQASSAEDDVDIQAFVDAGTGGGTTTNAAGGPTAPAGDGKLTIENLTYDSNVDANGVVHVTNADTPVGMADRIPPRTVTSLGFTISVALTEGQKIHFAVDGQNNNNGEVMFVAADGSTASGVYTGQGSIGGTIKLFGATDAQGNALQTMPGFAGNLTLVAYVDGNANSKITSAGFSVAAIPINFQETFQRVQGRLNPDGSVNAIRFLVNDTWESDSGNTGDLDKVIIKEAVQYVTLTGTWSGWTTQFVAAYNPAFPASTLPQNDSHIFPGNLITGNGGNLTAYQVHLFWDQRTGSTDVVMPNSGFVIIKNIIKNAAGYDLHFEKFGSEVTVTITNANGGTTNYSDAGGSAGGTNGIVQDLQIN